ncbi:hypothetical protein [Stigmatella aurantiaca]|uniref:DUF4177 domain-containing protein n=1 Tax=Stigmatella aurantiaca (strain DW4/3-1) TaxID=378806 RepID=E3FEJ1_STIAD|nr:hypothetical protein [Stigmatella aurantiaca]ADO75147.1 uncharacterized protein STAUR_7391 [Stigmatella aurantiaca DW4/3-1]
MDRRSASLLLLAGLVTGALSTFLLPRAAQAQAPFADPVEYESLKREGPEEDLTNLRKLGAEGWKVAATVEVDGTTKRYVLMRSRR